MFFLVALFLFLFFSQPKSVQATNSVPLFYQLIEAYKPNNVISSNNLSVINDQVSIVSDTSTSHISVSGTGEMVTIAVLGDSMIDTLGSNIPQLQKALTPYFPGKKFKILNYGVSASTMEYALSRLTKDYQYLGKSVSSLVSQSPDVVVVESFAYNNFGNTQSGFDKQSQLITNIINTIHDKLPKANLLLATTFSPNSMIFANGSPDIKLNNLEKIERTTTIKNYLENFVNYAKDHHIPIADAYHPSLVQNDGNRNLINSKDNIHPSSYGGEFFCNILAKALFDNHLVP